MKKIRISHMYPKLLNIYGDNGNILTLKNRCEWRGIQVEINCVNTGENSLKESDIYFIGGGQDSQQIEVAKELQRHKDFLLSECDAGKVFLGICGGYQLLGHYYKPFVGEELPGISLLDAYTKAGEKRHIGNVTVKSYIDGIDYFVGFENHSGQTFLQGETKPLGKVVIGGGNNGQDGFEGARFKNVFGTYLHGSFLPKNVQFADYMIELALGEKIQPIEDELETLTHEYLINKKY